MLKHKNKKDYTDLVDIENVTMQGEVLNTVSLFSGCGGLDTGFIGAFDISLILNKEIPNCDIVIGGFLCQDFSIAGKQSRFN